MDYPKMIAPGVAVIGRLEPVSDQLNQNDLRAAALEVAKKSNLDWMEGGWVDVRKPEENKKNTNHYIAANWHRDHNGHSQSPEMSLLLWSNREQTEILLPDGTVLNPDPGDVLLVHNDSVEHRTPGRVSEDRWWFRGMVYTPGWMEIAK